MPAIVDAFAFVSRFARALVSARVAIGPELRRGVAPAALVAVLAACSPALNWREVRPEAADGLVAMFPCKPEAHVRQVPWPGLPQGASMRLLSCQTAEATWALSAVALSDVRLLGPGMDELTVGVRRNLAAAATLAGDGPGLQAVDLGPIEVPGMTAMAQAHGWRFEGRQPDGAGGTRTMVVQTWHFSHGMTVFQASVWRPAESVRAQSSEDVADAFFHGLHFPR